MLTGELERALGREIELRIADESKLNISIRRFYGNGRSASTAADMQCQWQPIP